MIRLFKIIPIIAAFSLFILSSCTMKSTDTKSNLPNAKKTESTQINSPSPKVSVKTTSTPEIDYKTVKPNEAGKVIVVMFHNFVQSFSPSKYDKGEYTTTFDSFRKLLPSLYEKGFRLISLYDYINNNIKTPAGYVPMVFTFDDGSNGQFNLIEENGKLVANPQSAVGILEDFNKTHPDFGINGTFFVNLGLETFDGKGTLEQRLKYLTQKGFEIGNHTFTHVHLNEIKSADKVQEEIGKNQIKMFEIISGYKMNALALPYGQASKELQPYVASGEFNGTKYENKAIMEVGWDPAPSPVSKRFNPLSTHRVRASGISPVDADLEWWLKNFSKNELYISDGDENTIAIPSSKASDIDESKIKDKKLITY